MPPDEIESLATEIDDGSKAQSSEAQGEQPEAEDEGQEEGGQDEGPDAVVDEPQRRTSRRDARIERLLAARDADKERADRLERQLQEIRDTQRQPQQRQESPEEEAARLSLMQPEERSDYKLNKALRQVDEISRRSAFQASEVADKAAFEAKVQMDPLYAKLAPDVEKELATLRAGGQNVPREILFQLAVGRAALAARGKKNGQKERGAANLRRETTAPLNGKGDQSAARRRTNDTPAKRLVDVQI